MHDPPPDSTVLGDRTLAAAAALGDRTAFETIVRRYGPLLYGYVRRMIADHSSVDDVVQETFVAAWRQIDGYRGDATLKTWLFRICDRKVIDSRRLRYAAPIDDRLLDPVDASARRPGRRALQHRVPGRVGACVGRTSGPTACMLGAAGDRRLDVPRDRRDPDFESRCGPGTSPPGSTHSSAKDAAMAAMNGDDPLATLLSRAGQALRELGEPGWDRIADTVIAAVRNTPRSGWPLTVEDPDPHPSQAGSLAVSDLVVRSALAAALRLDQICIPTAVDILTDGTDLTRITVEIAGRYGDQLTDVAEHVRQLAHNVLDDLLGAAALGHHIDVAVIDIVAGNPLAE